MRDAQIAEHLQPGKFDVCVTSYEMVIKEKNALKKFHWRYIIIAARRIDRENSRLSKTMRMFAVQQPFAHHRHAVTEQPARALGAAQLFAAGGFRQRRAVRGMVRRHGRRARERRGCAAAAQGVPAVQVASPQGGGGEATSRPKKEMILKVGMSEMQKDFYKKRAAEGHRSRERAAARAARLLNMVMQLRKCCNHPYLFQGAERVGGPYFAGEHLIENSGKLILLDKLLNRLKEKARACSSSRRCASARHPRGLHDLPPAQVLPHRRRARRRRPRGGDRLVQRPGSSKFVRLLSPAPAASASTSSTADTVIIYDSDWNPQMDLQAMDRAHRIGQKKRCSVFRFCTDNSVEEKVIEKAYKKLALDALVIQQGRLQENQKNLNKDELLSMVRYGADKIFDGAQGTADQPSPTRTSRPSSPRARTRPSSSTRRWPVSPTRRSSFPWTPTRRCTSSTTRTRPSRKRFEGRKTWEAVISANCDRPAQAASEEELQRVRLLPRRPHGGGRVPAQERRARAFASCRTCRTSSSARRAAHYRPALYNKDVARKQFDWQRARRGGGGAREQRHPAGAPGGEAHGPAAAQRRRARRVRGETSRAASPTGTGATSRRTAARARSSGATIRRAWRRRSRAKPPRRFARTTTCFGSGSRR